MLTERVKMTCGGCSGAVTRVLERAKTNGNGAFAMILLLKGMLMWD